MKPVFCIMIAPEMQRKGIAAQLLARVYKDAAADGFDFVEAYINKEFIYTDHDFRGPLALYEKCGFISCAERNVVEEKARMMTSGCSVTRNRNGTPKAASPTGRNGDGERGDHRSPLRVYV